MKIKKYLLFVCLFVAALLLTSATSTRVGPTYAIINCKIIPVSGPPIEKGVIIIRDGLIESLGPRGKISIPEDAEVIEADGLFAYPGLIDAHTNLFLKPEKEKPQGPSQMRARSTEPQEKEKGHQPGLMAFKLLKPKKSAIENFHKVGITTVLVAPEKGIFPGQSVLLNLNGEKTETMVIQNPIGLHVNFSTLRKTYPSSLMGTMAFLRQSFLDTEHYSLHKSQFTKSSRGIKRPEYNPFLETILPYVVQKKPIFFNCANLEDIKRALRLIKEFRLNGFLTGCNEAWRVADLIKKAKVPLLVSLNFKPPFTSIYSKKGEELKKKAEKEIYPANAANLYKQGIPFALTSHGVKEELDILKNIRKAIQAGLSKDEVLKAMTIIPAKFLGVSSFIGSLEPGKVANIILASGEIFEEKTKMERVFVDGVSFEIRKPAKRAEPPALNIAGKWRATLSVGPTDEMEATLEIEQEGNKISGALSSNFCKWKINDGLLSGNDLTFTLAATIMGETMEIPFSGRAEKNTIEGTIFIRGKSKELVAIRIPEKGI